jgi:type II secretory pathway predicted ATPase ExeA
MEHSTKIEIVNAATAYMELHKMSQADVSNKIGVRKEYLSIILKPESNFMYDAGKGNQGFIPAKHFNALATMCGFQTEKVYWQLQPTAQTSAVLAHLQDAKKHSQTIVLIGETGCGKSYTSSLFASKNPLDTFIVTAGSSDSLVDLIEKIRACLNINGAAVTKSTKIRTIAQKLRSLTFQSHKPMLIIDESEYLKQPALCAIKELHDYIHEYCSIVLVGTDQLISNIDRLRKRNQSGIPQFHRRIKFGLRILPNIDRGFSLFINDIEDRELKKFLLQNCNNYGELHDIIVPATRESERLNEPLSMGLVRRVLNLPEGNLIW